MFALLLYFLAGLPASNAEATGHNDSGSETHPLQTTQAVRSLSPKEAARAYPVHLHATVVFYDPTIDQDEATFFVRDATGGIFVMLPALPVLPLREGTLVEVTGVSGAGEFAPVISHPHIRVLGEAPLPNNAPLVSLGDLMDGTYDSQRVQVEGTVHSVVPRGENMVVTLATSSGMISATTIRQPDINYAGLVDARIRAYAVAASKFNQRRQLAGVHLFFSSMQDVTVLRHGPSDAFSLPLRSISRMAEFDPGTAVADRIHVRGVVTLQRPGQLVCIQDPTGGLCVDTLDKAALQLGTVVDVVGFRATEEGSPKLTDAVFRRADESLQPTFALPISGAQALQGNHAGEVVQLEGEIAGLNSDPSEPAVLISSGTLVFSAVLPEGTRISDRSGWQKGSKVRVVGICATIASSQVADQRQGEERYVGFRILMRSPGDLTIVQRASWWTPVHAILGLCVALVITLAALGWALFLHRRVRQQTETIQESESRYRHLAYHDPLTGLPNRALMQQRLQDAIEQTTRTEQCLALLVLDLDGFKQINDSLGHGTGDQVLCIAANRISHVVRGPDTVARIGGDEFVIVLRGLRDANDACSYANRLLQSVSSPMQVGDETASLSCSIGISMFHPDTPNAHTLLTQADAAMYRSKMGGRNQFRMAETRASGTTSYRDREPETLQQVELVKGALG